MKPTEKWGENIIWKELQAWKRLHLNSNCVNAERKQTLHFAIVFITFEKENQVEGGPAWAPRQDGWLSALSAQNLQTHSSINSYNDQANPRSHHPDRASALSTASVENSVTRQEP